MLAAKMRRIASLLEGEKAPNLSGFINPLSD